MSVADSGEYVCRANNNIDAQEASIVVSVSPSSSNPSSESDLVPGKQWGHRLRRPLGEGALGLEPSDLSGSQGEGSAKCA
jgi:hypothetical protein